MRGMIIQCVGCGYSKHIELDGTPEQIEQRCNDTIVDGWRYEKTRDGYACPKCCKNGPEDKLYELYVGKLRTYNKVESYRRLVVDMAVKIKQFQRIDKEVERYGA